jgi:hypothetical protein
MPRVSLVAWWECREVFLCPTLAIRWLQKETPKPKATVYVELVTELLSGSATSPHASFAGTLVTFRRVVRGWCFSHAGCKERTQPPVSHAGATKGSLHVVAAAQHKGSALAVHRLCNRYFWELQV